MHRGKRWVDEPRTTSTLRLDGRTVSTAYAQPQLELLQRRAALSALAGALRSAKIAALLERLVAPRFARGVAWRSLEAGVEAVCAAGSPEEIDHGVVANVLEAAFTAEAPLVPDLPARLDKAAFTFQDQHGLAAGRAVALRATVGSEARSAQEPRARTDIVDGKTGTNRCGIGVYGRVRRERCGTECADEA